MTTFYVDLDENASIDLLLKTKNGDISQDLRDEIIRLIRVTNGQGLLYIDQLLRSEQTLFDYNELKEWNVGELKKDLLSQYDIREISVFVAYQVLKNWRNNFLFYYIMKEWLINKIDLRRIHQVDREMLFKIYQKIERGDAHISLSEYEYQKLTYMDKADSVNLCTLKKLDMYEFDVNYLHKNGYCIDNNSCRLRGSSFDPEFECNVMLSIDTKIIRVYACLELLSRQRHVNYHLAVLGKRTILMSREEDMAVICGEYMPFLAKFYSRTSYYQLWYLFYHAMIGRQSMIWGQMMLYRLYNPFQLKDMPKMVTRLELPQLLHRIGIGRLWNMIIDPIKDGMKVGGIYALLDVMFNDYDEVWLSFDAATLLDKIRSNFPDKIEGTYGQYDEYREVFVISRNIVNMLFQICLDEHFVSDEVAYLILRGLRPMNKEYYMMPEPVETFSTFTENPFEEVQLDPRLEELVFLMQAMEGIFYSTCDLGDIPIMFYNKGTYPYHPRKWPHFNQCAMWRGNEQKSYSELTDHHFPAINAEMNTVFAIAMIQPITHIVPLVEKSLSFEESLMKVESRDPRACF